MSTPAKLDLDMYRGDTFVHQLIFQVNGEPIDLSAYTFTAQVRDRPDNGTVILASFTITNADADTGVLVLNLEASLTNIPAGFWDFQADDGSSTTTWLKGTVKMSGDVTKVSA